MSPAVTIVGIDCATKPRKTGLACGLWNLNQLRIEDATLGQLPRSGDAVVQTILNWLPQTGSLLLAIDAPLGWPHGFGAARAGHAAGDALDIDPSEFFNRHTDRHVQEKFGQRPLSVGADLIARTAAAALRLVDQLRKQIGNDIPLLWDPASPFECGVIEVYPAATLRQTNAPSTGYKEKEGPHKQTREKIVQTLQLGRIAEPDVIQSALDHADVLDACICVLAGAHFLNGSSDPPPELTPEIKREGWIWVTRD